MAEIGQRFGPYTCERRIGAGGMAETFVGRRQGASGFEQRVCIKVMRGEGDQALKQLFVREAATASLLRHGNIVQVIDVLEEGPALVLELVEGADLRTVLRSTADHKLDEPVVVNVAIELAKALAYAHGRTFRGRPHGIVHRDISPANVMISYAGEVKLADFGIAKAITSGADEASVVHGKLGYMAPEQAAGQPPDARADLFSLGVVMFEMLCGSRPFEGGGEYETLRRAARGEFPPVAQLAPAVSAGVGNVVERLLSARPQQRFQDAEAVLDALSPFAPPATTFRRLGSLASQARPHQTLLTAALQGERGPAHDSSSRGIDSLLHDEAGAGGTIPMEDFRAVQAQVASRGLSEPQLKALLIALSVVAAVAFAVLIWLA